MKQVDNSRRKFLLNSGVMLVGSLVALNTPLALAAARDNAKKLSVYNIHTGESGVFTFWEQGEYIQEEIAGLSRILRDHRSGEMMNMDTKLLDTLHMVQNATGNHRRFEIISGYRSPKSNGKLRKLDGKGGVAKKSFHMKGQAVDVRLPGTELAHLRKAASGLKRGGVGYYPGNNFVHLDTGWVRAWRERA